MTYSVFLAPPEAPILTTWICKGDPNDFQDRRNWNRGVPGNGDSAIFFGVVPAIKGDVMLHTVYAFPGKPR